MSEPIVFIIDDDISARRGITRLVKAAGSEAEPFASAADFLASGKWDARGCIVLDVQMPDMTGPELQEKLYNDYEFHLPIIFLSAHGDVPTTAKAMKMGAVDFLTKPVDSDDLLEAIRKSLSIDEKMRIDDKEVNIINDKVKSLTAREYEIMTYVITGMLNKQIAGALNISEETVKIHRGRVMQKLVLVSVAELVRLCERVGIAPNDNASL
jgi:FixJ family two-component response regulator